MLPIVISFIKGKKDLMRALRAYTQGFIKVERRLKEFLKREEFEKNLLELSYVARIISANARLHATISLIDRRNYVYYLYKLFGKLPDIMAIRIFIDHLPAASLYIIPRKKKRILSKVIAYLSKLEEINIPSLRDWFIFSSDEPRFALRFLSKRILELIRDLKDVINYIVVDYSQPNIEASFEVSEPESENIITKSIMLTTNLMLNIVKVKGAGKEKEITKFLRRALSE